MCTIHQSVDRTLEKYREQLQGDTNLIENSSVNHWPHSVTGIFCFISKQLYNPDLGIAYMKENNIINSRRHPIMFKHYTGLTPISYINQHRIAASKKVLSSQTFAEITITDVAYYVGYRRSSTYIKAFKRCEDIPPGRWRTKNFSR